MWRINALAKAIIGVAVLGLFSGVHADLYSDKRLVTVINNVHELQTIVEESDNLWIVQFCTQTHEVCQTMASAYGVMSELFKGIIHFGFVATDTQEGDEIAQKMSVPTDRAPLLYWFLDDKKKPTQIDPALDGAEVLVAHMAEVISNILTERGKKMGIQATQNKKKQQQQQHKSSTGASTVTVSGQQEWEDKVINNPLVALVGFTAPWCGHCKMLKGDWDEAADKVNGKGGQMVWVDATDPANEPIAEQFQVQGFPTILLFPGGAPKNPATARQYPGDRKTSAMVKYLLAEVDKTGVPKEVPQLVSDKILEAECKGHNHICVLAALPHILDSGAAGRNGYREKLQQVAKTFRGGAFSFLWFEGGTQPALETELGLTFGFPAMVAYSMDRHAFAVLHGSFEEKQMTKFLHGVTNGRVAIGKLKQEKVPKIEAADPWDGKDGELPEEEFSLDDIMGSSDDDDAGEEGATNDEL